MGCCANRIPPKKFHNQQYSQAVCVMLVKLFLQWCQYMCKMLYADLFVLVSFLFQCFKFQYEKYACGIICSLHDAGEPGRVFQGENGQSDQSGYHREIKN